MECTCTEVCLRVCAPRFCFKVCALPCDLVFCWLIDWLIDWVKIACTFFPLFLENRLKFGLHVYFIRRLITRPIGRLDLAECGRFFSGNYRFLKCADFEAYPRTVYCRIPYSLQKHLSQSSHSWRNSLHEPACFTVEEGSNAFSEPWSWSATTKLHAHRFRCSSNNICAVPLLADNKRT